MYISTVQLVIIILLRKFNGIRKFSWKDHIISIRKNRIQNFLNSIIPIEIEYTVIWKEGNIPKC